MDDVLKYGPPDYFEKDLEGQIDSQLDCYLPHLVGLTFQKPGELQFRMGPTNEWWAVFMPNQQDTAASPRPSTGFTDACSP